MTNIITITANQQRAIERSATRFAASADVLRSVYEQYRAPESLELIKNYGAEFAAISAVSKVAPQKVMSNVEASSAAVRGLAIVRDGVQRAEHLLSPDATLEDALQNGYFTQVARALYFVVRPSAEALADELQLDESSEAVRNMTKTLLDVDNAQPGYVAEMYRSGGLSAVIAIALDEVAA